MIGLSLLGATLLGIVSFVLGIVFTSMETAFYRVSKLRIKLDAMGQDSTAKRLLWFANNPGFFIATLLVGNNITLYGASVAMVLFVGCLLPNASGIYAELAATLILTPILFVWGEMFPKYLALNLPNKILRRFSPIVLVFCWLFLPLSLLLWGINRLIVAVLKKPNAAISLSLGRREMSNVLTEGKDTGLLSDTQRRLAEGIFNCSDRIVEDYILPQSHLPAITTAMKPEEVLEISRKYHHLALPVYESGVDSSNFAMPIGYVRTIDLEIAVRHQLDEQTRQLALLLQTELPLRSIVELSSKHSLLTGLVLLQTMQASFGCVVDEQGRCLGFVSADTLCGVLMMQKMP